MNKYLYRSRKVLAFAVLFVFTSLNVLSNSTEKRDTLPDPQIKMGIAKLSGKIIHMDPDTLNEKSVITLMFPNPVTAEIKEFKTELRKDGTFNFEVPIVCNILIGSISSNIFESPILIGLEIGKETKIEFVHTEVGPIKAKMKSGIGLTVDNPSRFNEVMQMMHNPIPERYKLKLYKLTPAEYAQDAIQKNLKKRLSFADNDTLLTEKTKIFLINDFKMFFLAYNLFDYKNTVLSFYRYAKSHEEESEDFTPQEPGRTYYSFLKYFDFNNPQNLYSFYLIEAFNVFFSDETLNIQPINDTPIEEWLTGVKATMADLLGFNSGPFYDLLVVNAYARQFNNELKPLSEKQKENIRNYFTNKDIAKILLERNEEIVKLDREKRAFDTVVNETPVVSKEKLMEAIVSKYKGKAVLVDFWATWCAPCLKAMEETRDVKREMKGKDIVFVYITNTSSPKKLWEEKIKGIGGEHYYLTQEEWIYIMDTLDFDAIPTYLFYNADGVLKEKVTAYPGSDKMLRMIEELLP